MTVDLDCLEGICREKVLRRTMLADIRRELVVARALLLAKMLQPAARRARVEAYTHAIEILDAAAALPREGQ